MWRCGSSASLRCTLCQRRQWSWGMKKPDNQNRILVDLRGWERVLFTTLAYLQCQNYGIRGNKVNSPVVASRSTTSTSLILGLCRQIGSISKTIQAPTRVPQKRGGKTRISDEGTGNNICARHNHVAQYQPTRTVAYPSLILLGMTNGNLRFCNVSFARRVLRDKGIRLQ